MLQPDDKSPPAPAGLPFEKIWETRKDRSYTPGKVVKGLLGSVPLTVLNYSSTRARSFVSDLLKAGTFDSVQFGGEHLFPYIETVRAAPGRPPLVLDWHNVESELMSRYADESTSLPRRLIARRTAHLLRKIELQSLERCDAHTVVSQRERADLLARNSRPEIHVVPNGVDIAAYTSGTHSSPRTLLFVGSMDYHANVDAVTWFAREAWPAMAHRFPHLEFTVVGRSPSREVQMLASDRIRITGTVDDVRPYYSNALALIVPLRVGGGTRLKILEAMAMGVPVISTTIGAEGIAVTDGHNILLADSAKQMLAALDRIVSQPGLHRDLAEAGRRLVSENYDWTSIGNRLYDIHLRLIRAREQR